MVRPAAALDKRPATLESLGNGFLEAVTPKPEEYSSSRLSAENTIHALRRAFYPIRVASGLENDFLIIGGVGKRTALAPVKMIDVLYVLPPRLVENGSQIALKAIQAGAHDQFEPSELSEGELGITISIDRYEVRVIPAAQTKEGYAIPAALSSRVNHDWQRINPIAEAAALRLNDRVTNGRTRRLLTLLKSWRKTCDVNVPTLGLEFLVHEYYATQVIQSCVLNDFRNFVAWARSCTPRLIKGSGVSNEIFVGENWHTRAKAAFWRATLAKNTENDNLPEAASQWRSLLGSKFPMPDMRETVNI